MNPVQLETFEHDLGEEMDGPQVTEKDSGLTLSFSSDIVSLSTQVSHCQDKWQLCFGTIHFSFLTSLTTMYARDSCKTGTLALSLPLHHTRSAPEPQLAIHVPAGAQGSCFAQIIQGPTSALYLMWNVSSGDYLTWLFLCLEPSKAELLSVFKRKNGSR